MEKILNFVKNNKIILIILAIVILIAIAGVSMYFFLDYQKKQYSLTEVSAYNYYALNENNKYGVINIYGDVVIEPIYDNIKIPNPEKDIFICEKDNNTTILNEKNEELFTQYDEVNAISINGIVTSIPYEKTVLKYKQNDKYGLINYEGKVITKPIYEEITGLVNKESELLVKKDGKYGVINAKGAKLIEAEYDDITADGFYSEENQYALSGYITKIKTRGWISFWVYKL